MNADDVLISMPTYPRLGAQPLGTSTVPDFPHHGPVHRSQFIPDETVGPHVRHILSTLNIRKRREQKVELNAPVFRDKKTMWPFRDPTVRHDYDQYSEDQDVHGGSAKENHIYMDGSSHGFGSCALQVTMQCPDVERARYLYDQLLPVGPVLLALTAGSPVYKGFLAATDARWNMTCGSLDDRTPEERGIRPLTNGQQQIPKSRFACNSTYLSSSPRLRPEYLDPLLPINRHVEKKLRAGGMDGTLATHFAHLFIRDPIITFVEDWVRLRGEDPTMIKEQALNGSNGNGGIGDASASSLSTSPTRIYATAFANPKHGQSNGTDSTGDEPPGKLMNPDSTEYFEKIQSSNWQHVRFKPPPPSSTTGWRVEFRGMEAQVTDFEMASFSIWIVLLARAILRYDLNLYIPITRVTENMDRAHDMDAVLHTRLHFREDILGSNHAAEPGSLGPVEDEHELKTVNEIINGGADGGFPGLASLVRRYVEEEYGDADVHSRQRLYEYLALVEGRASGHVETPARWMRRFITQHEDYHQDSVVGERIGWDLMNKLREVTASGGRKRAGVGFCRMDGKSSFI